MNLTPYFFFASPPKADKHFLKTPRLKAGVLTWQHDCVSLQPPRCPRPGEERGKNIVGTWARHEKLIRGQGPALTFLQEPGTYMQSGRF